MVRPFHIRTGRRPPYTALVYASAEHSLASVPSRNRGLLCLLCFCLFDVCNEPDFHSATSERNISSLVRSWLFSPWMTQYGDSETPRLNASHDCKASWHLRGPLCSCSPKNLCSMVGIITTGRYSLIFDIYWGRDHNPWILQAKSSELSMINNLPLYSFIITIIKTK